MATTNDEEILTTALNVVIASKVVEEMKLNVDPFELLETWNRIEDEVINSYIQFLEKQEANNETKHENPENSGT